MTDPGSTPRIGIVVVAYNAASTLLTTLDRIPHDFRSRIAEVIVFDDARHADTFDLGRGWAALPARPPTPVLPLPETFGTAGPPKAASQLAPRAVRGGRSNPGPVRGA